MKKRRTVHMNASWVRMGVLWVFAVAVAYVFFTIAQDVSAQGGSLLTLKPGEKVSIECLGSKLSLLRLLRTRWRITCEGTAPVTPTPIPTVTPNATPTPTGSAVHTRTFAGLGSQDPD